MTSNKYNVRIRTSRRLLTGTIALFLSATSVCQGQPVDFWNIDFAKADSIALKYEGYSLRKTEQLVDSLTHSLDTDVEKFRAIFRWITHNIAYDYQLYLTIINKEAKFKTGKKKSRLIVRLSKRNLRRLVFHRMAVCSGYATLLDYMCSLGGLQSVYISGYGRMYGLPNNRPNHAWNAVRLDGKWYLCDVTWASGWVDTDMKRFFKQYDESYFLTDPSLFISNHYPMEKRWTLLKNPPTLKEFLNSTFKATGFIENKINTYAPTNSVMRVKLNDQFRVAFTSNARKIKGEVSVLITDQKSNKQISNEEITLKRNDLGEYVLEFPLIKKGSFYVRIYINYVDTFVYQVIVF